jgi:hypothetical protein
VEIDTLWGSDANKGSCEIFDYDAARARNDFRDREIVSTARGHHWVSQTYLARFTHDGHKNSRLHVVDLRQRKAFSTSPANICKERDFNRIESDTLPLDALETALSKFEELAGRALTEVQRAPEAISWSNWNILLNFMALLAVRNPVIREHVHKRVADHWIRAIEDATDTPEKFAAVFAKAQTAGDIDKDVTPDFDKHREFLAGRRFTVEFPHGTHVPAEFDAVDNLLRQLGKRRWQVLRAPVDSGGFVTTDRPVTPARRDGVHPSHSSPVDFGSEDTLVLFPLSPDLLALGHSGDANTRILLRDIDRELVARANFTTVRVCRQWVLAPHANFAVKPAQSAPTFKGNDILDLFGEWEGGAEA